MPRIKERLGRNQVVRIFGLGQLFHSKWPELLEAHGGFHGLWLDQEHAGLTLAQLESAIVASRGCGLDHVVRLPATDYASLMRPLELGAGGLILSMIGGLEEAEEAVRWTKFWPRGTRGLNGGNRDGRFGLEPVADYMARVNAQTVVGVQIETAGALEQVEAIARIEDVDLLFVGPADLSQTLGVPGQFEHPSCLEAIDRVARACAAAGKPWGIVPRGTDYANRMREKGCRLFVTGFDHQSAHEGIRAFKARYADLFEADAD